MLKRMLKDCIPTIIALTFTGLYSVIDGLFIGTAVGDIGLAAINLAWPIPALLTALGLGIGTGGSILYSNAKGRGTEDSSRKIMKVTLGLLLTFSVLAMFLLHLSYKILLQILGADGEAFTQAVAYCQIIILGSVFQISGAGIIPLLRNSSMPIQAMVATITGMITNCSLNYLLIIRCDMGIRGAAIGTIIAQDLVCGICLFEMWKAGILKEIVCSVVVMDDIQKKAIEIIKTGFPAFGVSLAPTVVLIFTNWQCLRLGGEQAVAAYAVISYIVFPVQSLLQGVGDGLQPLMSYYVGAQKTDELGRLRKYAYKIIGILGVAAFGISCFGESYIEEWFNLSEKAAQLFQQGFLVSAISFFFYGYNKFNIAYMNSHLQVKTANGLIYGESLIVSPILIFTLPLLWGISGIWLSLPFTAVIIIIIYFIKIKVR